MRREEFFLKTPRLRVYLDDEFRWAAYDNQLADRMRWVRPNVLEILWAKTPAEKQTTKLAKYKAAVKATLLRHEPGRVEFTAVYPQDVPEDFRFGVARKPSVLR